ncbi:MAG: tol-pal system protein YbgF [Burkholderiales bacterium]|nr:tol-pal system protein YbgF [Burkholderiales bacterium]
MRRAGLGLILLAASHTAAAGLFSDDEAHKRIEALQQENQQLQQKLKAMDERVTKLDATLRSQGLLDLLQSVEAMKNDMAKLRGQIEVNTYNIDTTQKRQKDLYVDLDNRLRKLERVDGPALSATPTPGATTAPATPAAASDPAAENRTYESAFNLFKIGNYQAAIAGFQNFLKTYPASPLAANAQYWIGNSHSALKDYKTAIAQQQKLIHTYPSSPKVPDALLNIASSQAELGDKDSARKSLEEIVAKHPLSPAADTAKKRLANLK